MNYFLALFLITSNFERFFRQSFFIAIMSKRCRICSSLPLITSFSRLRFTRCIARYYLAYDYITILALLLKSWRNSACFNFFFRQKARSRIPLNHDYILMIYTMEKGYYVFLRFSAQSVMNCKLFITFLWFIIIIKFPFLHFAKNRRTYFYIIITAFVLIANISASFLNYFSSCYTYWRDCFLICRTFYMRNLNSKVLFLMVSTLYWGVYALTLVYLSIELSVQKAGETDLDFACPALWSCFFILSNKINKFLIFWKCRKGCRRESKSRPTQLKDRQKCFLC